MSASIAQAGAVVFAKNLPTMARFYRELLGMAVLHSEADHVVLEGAGIQLVIHAIPKRIAAQIVIADPPVARDETPIKLFFAVTSLADARVRAASLGGRLAPPGKQWSARGFTACDGVDPEGNMLQLRQTGP
ncbi:MAG TPA: VOC family protein [Burkholderiaceae bacterium]|nr:VOC family protein [Burkholderiaceae bacterium]